jgi:HD-like signal output (HDOD) protein
MNSKAVSFIKKCHIPGALPQIYEQAAKIVHQSNIPQPKLARILSSDVVISANILKQVNSALYKGRSSTGNISKAITVLGLGQIRLLVKNITKEPPFPDNINTYASIEEFWKHSIAVGTASRIIDRTLGGNSDELYTAGLLHDFGRLIMLANADKMAIADLAGSCIPTKELLYKHERKILGFNHMELADALFHEWNMPAVVREAAAFHHSPKLAIRCRYETAVVHIADVICRALELGKCGSTFVPILDSAITRFIHFQPDMLDYICEETSHQVEDRLKLYNL